MAAGNIFLGMHHIQLVSGFIALPGNREETNAVNRTGGGATLRHVETKFVPGKVREISDEEKS